jgi:competence protein ComEC
MYIDRPFNIRPFCFWAFFVGAVILCCYYLTVWAAGIFVVLVAAFLFSCQFIKSKDAVLKFFGISKRFFVITLALMLGAMLSYGIAMSRYENTKTYPGMHVLTGMVETSAILPSENDSSRILISNATFDGKKLSGRVIVYISKTTGDEIIETGDNVEFTTQIRPRDAEPFNINNRTKYYANVKITDIKITGQNKNLKHTVLRYSRNNLNKFLDADNAQLMYSMIFGDKSALDGELNNQFRVTGLAHALAVSGLHVGLLIGMLVWLLRTCKLRRKYQFPIVLAVLLFYSYVCDFKYSIIRASVMFLVILALKIYTRKTDMLSCICASAVLTLLIFPTALWSWSFALSYGCMFGIAILFKPIKDLLQKISFKRAPNVLGKIQNKITDGISLYICVTVSTLPLVIKYFGYFPLYGVISNLLILPMLVLAFQICVAALLTGTGAILLPMTNHVVTFTRRCVNFVANLPHAQIFLSNGGVWFWLYFLGLIFCTRFIFVKNSYKYTAAVLLFLIYCIGFV